MVCPNCKMQIPDTSAICPSCGFNVAGAQMPPRPQQAPQPQFPPQQSQQARPQPQSMPSPAQMQVQSAHAQIHHEIKKRRWQRWVFYILLIVVFGGMTFYALSIYNKNTALINSINSAQDRIKEAEGNLATANTNLGNKDTEISKLKQATIDNQKALDLKMQELQNTLSQQSALINDLNQYKELSGTAENTYASLSAVASNVALNALQKIPLADVNLVVGKDTDGDGLSDDIETALGTNINNTDTDGDKYSDKSELFTGYDPLIAAKKLAYDTKVAQANKGKILKQEGGYLWYITMDGKKAFLGKMVTPAPVAPVSSTASSTSILQ